MPTTASPYSPSGGQRSPSPSHGATTASRLAARGAARGSAAPVAADADWPRRVEPDPAVERGSRRGPPHFLRVPQTFLRRIQDTSIMKRTRIVLATFGVLALAGGGTAIAAKGKGGSARLRAGFVGHKFHGPGQLLDTAASYLGVAPADLAAKLRGGTTLAQIASATQGKTAQGLVDALVAAEKKGLADAVTAKRLTQAQADAIAKELPQRTTDFVNGAHRGPGFRGGPGFHRGHWDDLQVVADYLGTPVSSVVTQLMSGKTLAAIAN